MPSSPGRPRSASAADLAALEERVQALEAIVNEAIVNAAPAEWITYAAPPEALAHPNGTAPVLPQVPVDRIEQLNEDQLRRALCFAAEIAPEAVDRAIALVVPQPSIEAFFSQPTDQEEFADEG